MIECSTGCGNDARDGVIITAHVSPGPRENRNDIAIRPTLVPGFRVCAECLFSPWGVALRELVNDPSAAGMIGVGHDCVTVCRGRPIRGWRWQSVELFRRWKCPRCMGTTRIWTADQAPPAAIWALLRAVPRGIFRRAWHMETAPWTPDTEQLAPARAPQIGDDEPPPRVMLG